MGVARDGKDSLRYNVCQQVSSSTCSLLLPCAGLSMQILGSQGPVWGPSGLAIPLYGSMGGRQGWQRQHEMQSVSAGFN
jgi:hypothetical protein